MDKSKYYYELNGTSVVSDELLEFSRSIKNWDRPAPWVTFLMNFVPTDILQKDAVISKLIDQGWNNASIFKSYPSSYYQFHIDRGNRPVAINLLLGEPDSMTFFLGKKIHTNQFELLRMNYKPNKYYLLNTSRSHAIMNFGEERYVFSLCPPLKYIESFDIKTGNQEGMDKNVISDFRKTVFDSVIIDLKNANL